MSASEASSFEELTLESNDQERTVDLRTGVVSVDYYEDILSPTVTAKIRVINTGDSISPKDPIDQKKTDGAKQSIYNGLPLRGGERLVMKILDQGKTFKGQPASVNAQITNALINAEVAKRLKEQLRVQKN